MTCIDCPLGSSRFDVTWLPGRNAPGEYPSRLGPLNRTPTAHKGCLFSDRRSVFLFSAKKGKRFLEIRKYHEIHRHSNGVLYYQSYPSSTHTVAPTFQFFLQTKHLDSGASLLDRSACGPSLGLHHGTLRILLSFLHEDRWLFCTNDVSHRLRAQLAVSVVEGQDQGSVFIGHPTARDRVVVVIAFHR